MAHETDLHFVQISAIFSGVADLKKVFEAARGLRSTGKGTLLFVDEIHRFNRAQLDAFLPVMEDGTITLVGATTENPSFELNAALLSRARVLVFRSLDEEAIQDILTRAEEITGKEAAARRDGEGVAGAHGGRRWPRGADAGRGNLALGEARRESSTPSSCRRSSSAARRSTTRARRAITTSSRPCTRPIRGSDPDAALYYLARMLDAGEDRLFIARRLVRVAIEDIGLADPQALVDRQRRQGRVRFSRLAGG